MPSANLNKGCETRETTMKNISLGISKSCASFPVLRMPRFLPLVAFFLWASFGVLAEPFAFGPAFGLLTGMRGEGAGVGEECSQDCRRELISRNQ